MGSTSEIKHREGKLTLSLFQWRVNIGFSLGHAIEKNLMP